MGYYTGKIAIVTGAASGIGKALSEELARRGAVVVLTDINEEKARKAAAGIEQSGGKARALKIDVADAQAVKDLVGKVTEVLNRIDFMFNNAGISIGAEVQYATLEEWNRVLDVNVKGVIHGVQAVYPIMIKQGSGHIINTSSTGGLVPWPLAIPYITTKHAIFGLTASLRAEAADLGVKVSAVCPGMVDTPIYESMDYPHYDKEKLIRMLPSWKLSPERCARKILKGVERNKAIILVGADARVYWGLYRVSPGLYLRFNRLMMKYLRKKGGTG